MKKWLIALMFLAANVKANPYVYVPYITKDAKLYLSQGILLDTKFGYSQTFTNAAILYHPLSSGSIIPEKLQNYLPPESWSVNLGAGYLSSNKVESIGPGLSVNLLDSVRAYSSNLLKLSSYDRLQALGSQIAPGSGPLNITFGPQWVVNVIDNGVIVPFNRQRLVLRWFVGASYGF